MGFIADDSRVSLTPIRMSNPFINLRKFVLLLSLTLVLVCFGFSLNAPGSTFAPTEEERVAATEQGLSGELKLAALPRKIDPEGRTYVEVDDMFFSVSEGAGVESAFTGNRWTNGIVYYVFDAAVSSTNRQNWRDAAATWSAVAPLTFTERYWQRQLHLRSKRKRKQFVRRDDWGPASNEYP